MRSHPLLLALVLLAVTVPSLRSQEPVDETIPEVSPRIATPGDLSVAAAYLEEARLYEASPDRSGWLAAARLHRKSAAHRPLGDEQVFRCLHRAAQLFHVMGRDREAQVTLEQAAAHARLYGQIAQEAKALLKAAWMAERRGDLEAMNRHLSRAFLLSYSPFLPAETKAEVRQRVLLPAILRFPMAVTAEQT